MNTKKLIELQEMLEYYGYADVTYMENGKMSDSVRCTSVVEVETLLNIHGELWF